MADKKISTIILEVDLDCCCCVKIITILKKFPEIQTQTLNHEKKTVTISGPFDPEKLMKCICCKAGKYIKSYVIVPDPPKPKPSEDVQKPTKPSKPVEEPKPTCTGQTDPVPCRHGCPPLPCPSLISARVCYEAYWAGSYSRSYAPPCGCHCSGESCHCSGEKSCQCGGKESTCPTM